MELFEKSEDRKIEVILILGGLLLISSIIIINLLFSLSTANKTIADKDKLVESWKEAYEKNDEAWLEAFEIREVDKDKLVDKCQSDCLIEINKWKEAYESWKEAYEKNDEAWLEAYEKNDEAWRSLYRAN